MRWSQTLIPTLKETPADAEIISHKLLLRAGLLRKLTGGLYTFLPLAVRALRKVEQIVREEMNRAGALELLLPAVQPAELWQETGRWDQFGPQIIPVPWEAIGNVLPRAGLLVNTTSLGMRGQPPLAIEVGLLPAHAVVADLVYLPLQTPLLAAAQARGLKTADGLGMLLHQAVRGFELWFGQRPEVTPELRELVEDDLTNT